MVRGTRAAGAGGGRGVAVGSAAMQDSMVRAVENGGIKPVIDANYDLSEIAAAFSYQASAKHFGKITLSI